MKTFKKLSRLIADELGDVKTLMILIVMTVAMIVAWIIVGVLTSLNLGLSGNAATQFATMTGIVYTAMNVTALSTVVYAAWSLLGIIAPKMMGGRK